MSYNKTKRVVGIIGSLVAILMGAISFIGGLIWTIKLFSLVGGEAFQFMTIETIAFFLMTISGLFIIILGIIACKNLFAKNGRMKFKAGTAITTLVFAFISIISCIILETSAYSFMIAFSIGYDTAIFIFELLLFIAVAVLYIVALCIKSVKEGQTVEGDAETKVQKYVEPADAPKYNPIKRAIEILAAVHTFIFGAFIIYDFSAYLEGSNGSTIKIIAILNFLVGVAVMVLGLLSVSKPKFINGQYKKGLGVKVAVIVLVSLATLFSLILNLIGLQKIIYRDSSFIYGYSYDFSYFIFFALVMGYMLIAMNLPTVKDNCKKENVLISDQNAKSNNEISFSENVTEVVAKDEPKEDKVTGTPAIKQEADIQIENTKPAVKSTGAVRKQMPPRANGKFVKKTDK
ncbi:MAG: hypothetical protein SPL13_01180 [Clostridia bacterium]|nr:hypothetical protein [Clostridia bacterium]